MRSQEAGRARRTGARVTFVVLVLCALAVAGMYVGWGRTSTGVVLAGALPAILLLAVIAALLGRRHRPWWRLVLVVGVLASQAPLLDHAVPDPGGPPPDARTIDVATLNTDRAGTSDAELVRLAGGTDVLALQEWDAARTPGLTDALGDGWRVAASATDDSIDAEVSVWVRDPWTVESTTRLPGRQAGHVVHLRHGDDRVAVLGTRLQNPAFLAADDWSAGLDSLRAATKGASGPVVVLGDLNAPPSAVAFRRFVDASGLHGCTEQLGAGYPGTWGPTSGGWFAPVPIDHVLVRHARCTSLSVERLPGSDHRGLRAAVALD